MDEKEKDYKQAERSEDISSNREQNETHERSSSLFAWWYSLVELVFKKKNNVSDGFAIGVGVCSLLLVFLQRGRHKSDKLILNTINSIFHFINLLI